MYFRFVDRDILMQYIGSGFGHYKQEIRLTAVNVAVESLDLVADVKLEPEPEARAEEDQGKTENNYDIKGVGGVLPHAHHAVTSDGDDTTSTEEHWEDPSGGAELDSEGDYDLGSEAGKHLRVAVVEEEVSYEF